MTWQNEKNKKWRTIQSYKWLNKLPKAENTPHLKQQICDSPLPPRRALLYCNMFMEI